MTEPVRFAVEASLYVPVAVNCWVSPAAMVGLAGVTAMLLEGRRAGVRKCLDLLRD